MKKRKEGKTGTHLVVVLHDGALELGGVDPRHKVLHVSAGTMSRVDGQAAGTHLVTRYAGSVTVSGPTRTCPCSINFTAYEKKT
jgi:hypothetical protein